MRKIYNHRFTAALLMLGVAPLIGAPSGGGPNAGIPSLDTLGLGINDTPRFGGLGIGVAVDPDYPLRLSGKARLTATIADPVEEILVIYNTPTVTLSANNANAILASHNVLLFNPGAFNSTSGHNAGIGGYAIGNPSNWTGTINDLTGVIGGAGNNGTGAGVVVRAAAFRARPAFSVGPMTNYYSFLDENSFACGATNCYGASFGNPVSIGNPLSPPLAGYRLDVVAGPVVIRTVAGATDATPATSGQVQSAGHKMRIDGNSGIILDIGSDGINGTWFQGTDKTDLSAVRPIKFQRNGGTLSTGGTFEVTESLGIGGAPISTNRIDIYNSGGIGRFGITPAAGSGASLLTWPDSCVLNLSTSGATGAVLRQSTVGGCPTIATLAASNISNGASGTGQISLVADSVNQSTHVSSTTLTMNGASYVTLLGLVQTLGAGSKYSCDGHIHFTTPPTGSNGAKIQLMTTNTLTVNNLMFNAYAMNGTAVVAQGTATALAASAFSVTAAMTDIYMNAVVDVNVAGALQIQLGQATGSGTTEIGAGNARWNCFRTV